MPCDAMQAWTREPSGMARFGCCGRVLWHSGSVQLVRMLTCLFNALHLLALHLLKRGQADGL